ncbi:MAG TPA: cobyrinate a,c-diamide synthase [Dehalococcoidia bacterium]|nr:cobyrinate a,c-diamide synthase [Dehalococcoidia bacterium]
MKGVVVAGVASGVGKTTVAVGIMAALARRGLRVQPFKVGPDYIDPTYHQAACGVPSRNLDSWMLPHEHLRELFARAVAGCDVAVVEGVMGLFDGSSPDSDEGSTAQVAKLLGLPVLLVADARKVARSVAATVLGFQQFDPQVRIAGVLLNGIASPRHLDYCRRPIEQAVGLPVVGHLPRRDDLQLPERHLGLVPEVEGPVARDFFDRLAAQVEATVDLDLLLRLAEAPDPPSQPPRLFPPQPLPKRAVIAVARDRAFSFYYQDALDLLSAWGAEVVPVSPLEDASLPDGCGALYLGGGFPELYARELAGNAPFLQSLREAVLAKLPVYAECGGLMYLGRELVDAQGTAHVMAGLLPLRTSMEGARLQLGYRRVRALADGPVLAEGEEARGHEFHYSRLEVLEEAPAAYEVLDQPGRLEGFRVGSLWASYIHLHFGQSPTMAQRLVTMAASHAHGS